jgi:plastocyanin
VRRNKLIIAAAALVLTTTSFATSACDDAADADPTPVRTWKITPAQGGGQPTATAQPVETPSPAATAPNGGEATELELVAQGSLFDKEELTAPAGRIVIELDNQDAGVVHNVAVYRGSNARGEEMGATDLEVGPLEQTLELELEPGEYYYQCDAHPTTMSGTLTVT